MAAQVPLPLFVRVVFAHETAKSSFLLSQHAISPRSTRFAGFALTTVWQCFHTAEDRTATPSPAAAPQHLANWHLGVAAPRSRCDESPSCTTGNTLKVRPTCPTLFPHRPRAATHGEVRPLRPSSSALSKGTSVYSVLEMPHKCGGSDGVMRGATWRGCRAGIAAVLLCKRGRAHSRDHFIRVAEDRQCRTRIE